MRTEGMVAVSGQTHLKVILDEMRNRFVYPQDTSFIVYFEWEGPAGIHVLTASWKQPDGTALTSPDVKAESVTRELTCYWSYIMDPSMMPGTWVVEVRVDGQPAGSHSFEIAGTSLPKREDRVVRKYRDSGN